MACFWEEGLQKEARETFLLLSFSQNIQYTEELCLGYCALNPIKTVQLCLSYQLLTLHFLKTT